MSDKNGKYKDLNLEYGDRHTINMKKPQKHSVSTNVYYCQWKSPHKIHYPQL